MFDEFGREIFVYYDNKHIFYSDINMTVAELCKNSKQFKFTCYDRDYFKGNRINVRKYYINSEEERYAETLKHRITYRFLNFINDVLYKTFVKS